ncbi:hypothetical protein BC835DRAFT_1416206 [Cytidiella melzeri]|nr:hypothetical protein BC835DRAFT_1416206 [Cytidiella melzeri]
MHITSPKLIHPFLAALYAFDYLITIGQEVNFVWKQKWKLSTLLFVVNRYVALVVAAIYAVPLVNYEFFRSTGRAYVLKAFPCSCIVGIDILKVTALTQFLIIAVFSAQRIYVVAPRDRSHRWLVGLVFLLSMVPFAVNIWVFARDVLVYAPVTTCVSGVPGSHELQIRRVSPSLQKGRMAD